MHELIPHRLEANHPATPNAPGAMRIAQYWQKARTRIKEIYQKALHTTARLVDNGNLTEAALEYLAAMCEAEV